MGIAWMGEKVMEGRNHTISVNCPVTVSQGKLLENKLKKGKIHLRVGVFLAWLNTVSGLGQFSVIKVDTGWGCSNNCTWDLFSPGHDCQEGSLHSQMSRNRRLSELCRVTWEDTQVCQEAGEGRRSRDFTEVFTGRNRQDRSSE